MSAKSSAVVNCPERSTSGWAMRATDSWIPNGYDVDGTWHDSAAGQRLRASLGLDGTTPVLGMVAREDIYKDHETLLRAVGLMSEHLPSLRVILCGKGTDGAAMQARIKRHGLKDRVIALGVRQDMSAVYAAMNVHMLSSLSEGFPNVVAEATLNGCLSFCTTVGEAPRMLPGREYLLPVGDAPRMAENLLQALSLPESERTARVARQREFLAQHYSMPSVAERYRQAYEQIAPGLLAGASGAPA